MTINVPFVDLKAQYLSIKEDLDLAISSVIAKSAFINGEYVRLFEEEFASYCARSTSSDLDGESGMPSLQCAACGNGTDALYLALRAVGVGPGDEVITVAHTFIATVEAIVNTGAKPVFIDVLADTMLMDPDLIEAAISDRTKAIIAVHLYGQVCDMDRITAIARKYELKVIEDAAQAHGATWGARRTGALAHAACFSFYPGKNLGAYGDAGAVVSGDPLIIETVRMLANHGRLEKYTHKILGVNSRLDGLQAAVLSAKLRHLDAWNAARRSHAQLYLTLLKDSHAVLPHVRSETESVWHLFVVRVDERDDVGRVLRAKGIATQVHYPVPAHLQPACLHLGIPVGSLPVTERIAKSVLSLPMYAELSRNMIEHVVEGLQAASAESVAVRYMGSAGR